MMRVVALGRNQSGRFLDLHDAMGTVERLEEKLPLRRLAWT